MSNATDYSIITPTFKTEGAYKEAIVTLADLDNYDINKLIISRISGSGVCWIFSKGYTHKNGNIHRITVNKYNFMVSYQYETGMQKSFKIFAFP